MLLLPANTAGRISQKGQLRSAEDGSIGGGKENFGAHSRAAALAVHSRHTNAVAVRNHQIAKVVGTRKERLACRLCRQILGVIGSNGNRINNGIVACDICRIV